MSSDIVIRRATPDDAPALSLIGRATLLETYAALVGFGDIMAFANDGHSEACYDAFARDRECALWIAEVQHTGAPVGFVLLSEPDLPMTTYVGDIELRRIYTLVPYQGAGLGRRLFTQAIDYARETGRTRLLLGVKEDNLAAIGFYKRMGGEQVGTRRFQVGSTLFDDLLYGFRV